MEDQLRSMSLDSTPKRIKWKIKKKKKKKKVEEDTKLFALPSTEKKSVLTQSQESRAIRQAKLKEIKEDKELFASSHPPKVINYFTDIIRTNLPSRERETFHLHEVYETCVPLIEVEINEKKGSSVDARGLIKDTLSACRRKGLLELVYPNTRKGWYRWIPNTQYIDERQHGDKEKI